MKNAIVLLVVMAHLCSCGAYKPFDSSLNSQGENCDLLTAFVAEHWFKHKEKHLYKYKEKEKFLKEVNSTYKQCFFNLSIEEIKLLLGKPNEEIVNDELRYHVSEQCLQKYVPCELLVISFDNTQLTPVSIMMQ